MKTTRHFIKYDLIFILFSALIFLCFYKGKFFSYNYFFVGDPISYISHTSTILFDFDLNYENEISSKYNNQLMPPHPIGSSLIASVITFPFSLIDRFFSGEILINRFEYHNSFLIIGFLTSSIIMFFGGVFFYLKSAKYVLVKSNYYFFIILICGTGILYYVFNTPIYSHIYEFFILSLILFFSLKITRKFSILSVSILIFLLFLNLLIRYNNFNVLLLPLIILFVEKIRHQDFQELKYDIFKILFIIVSSFILANIITLFLYDAYIFEFSKIYSSEAVNKIYSDDYNLLNHIKLFLKNLQNLPILIFSFETGLIFSNPILVVSFFLIFIILIKLNHFSQKKILVISAGLLILSYFFFSLSIALNWKSTAGSYGYRYLLNILPLSIYLTVLFFKYFNNYFFSYFKIIIITLSINSFFSQLFADTTSKLSAANDINSYNITRDIVYKDYNLNIYKEIFTSDLYVTTFAKSIAGLIIAQNLEDKVVKKLVKPEFYIEYKKYYKKKGHFVTIKILYLFMVWMFFVILIRNKFLD